jgi:tetratricopeptide (TPR) repeat protein
LIQHFTGAAPNSADWKEVVRRLLAEFDRRLGVEVPVPDQPAALRAAFANALHMAAASSRAILVLDGLNQMEDADGATELAWLPEQVPPRLRFILSTVSGPVFDEIERRKWPVLEVRPLDVPERLRLIRHYLFQYRKHLAAAEETKISAAQQTASPLFLSALLEELRLFGSYEALGARIEEYLRAPDAVVLYEKILARYEEDYERDRGGLVRDAMSLIWAARRGLSEAELLELLGNSEDPLAGAIWSPLFLAAEAGLIVRSGLIAFSHDYLRQAVARRYLGDAAAKVAAHAQLVRYFKERPRGFRRTDELPWQMARTGEWHSLADYLAGPAALRDTWERSEFDARAYWADVEKSSPYRRSTVYASVAADPVQDLDHAWKVGLLLGDSGSRRQALELRQRLSYYFRAHDRPAALAANLGIEGNLHYVLGEFDQALALHTERERLYRALDEPERLAVALGDRALVLMDMGQADEALRLFREEERICSQFGSERGLQASLGNQALVLKRQGKHDEACKLLREQETICRRLIDRLALSNCLGNQGELHYDCKEHKAALRLLRRQKRIASELGYLPGLVRSLGDRALTQSALGKYRSALTLHAREQRLAETLEDPAAIAVSLANQAHLRGVKLNRKTEALQLLDQALALAEKHGIQALCDQILVTRSKIE